MESIEDIFSLFEEIDNLGSYESISASSLEYRLPRRGNIYLREVVNPFQLYCDEEFRRRYRFRKETVRNYILPLLQNSLQHQTKQGLPISVENQVLIALRFYATGSIQVLISLIYLTSYILCACIFK